MFKVKATVVGFDGDEEKYPCHFRYKVGEEIVFDGEKIDGRVCPSMLSLFGEMFKSLVASGGRHEEDEIPGSYFPFWHSPLSVYDPEYKKYDGVGFRPTLKRPDEGYEFIPDETLFDTPPGGNYIIGKGKGKKTFSLVCGDQHTLARFKVEAFDLADRGDSLPYYRRAMCIVQRIAPKPGISMEQIIDEFTRDEIDNIYPTLSQNMIASLVGELELLEYADVKDGKVSITDKGLDKLEQFKEELSTEEREALLLVDGL